MTSRRYRLATGLLFAHNLLAFASVPPHPSSSGAESQRAKELRHCDEWSAVVKDIAKERDAGKTMNQYITELKASNVPLSPLDYAVIQRVYSTTRSVDETSAAVHNECYALVLGSPPSAGSH